MIKANKVLAASFTFHNVSINSGVAMYCLAAVGMVVQAQINCKTILFGLFSVATAIQDVMPMQISSHFAEEALFFCL